MQPAKTILCIGDIHLFVTDLDRAVRFWSLGLGAKVSEKESSAGGGFARLEFEDGGPGLQLFGPVDPWDDDAPAPGTRPMVSFEIMTDRFDDALTRLLEHGGTQGDEIEAYESLRVVTVLDPDGNPFELLELPEEP